jgi:uncharacterized protein
MKLNQLLRLSLSVLCTALLYPQRSIGSPQQQSTDPPIHQSTQISPTSAIDPPSTAFNSGNLALTTLSPSKHNPVANTIANIDLSKSSSDREVNSNLSPKEVITIMYQGMRQVEGDRGTPKLKVIKSGVNTACGALSGTGYCPNNHTIYLVTKDIKMAYKYGDAALAFIIAHEYGHAMQFYYRFKPINVMTAELQADCIAGYYTASIPTVQFNGKDLNKIYKVSKFTGDYHFESSNHHGIPKKRAAATLAGIVGYMKTKSHEMCDERYLPQAIDEALEKIPNL